ncbi:MAG: selenium cofactor biosynthesis protein YqeC [Dehalococcoidia bacterium]|nr:selenium cofactor biosynthesis protein YqeC [Dehalococcoidia bacterium]
MIIDTHDLIAVNDLWHEVYPYLAEQVSELYGRAGGCALELGPFAGGMSYALATSHPQMNFTIADDHNGYMAYVKRNVVLRNLDSRVRIVDTTLDRLRFANGSFDLVMLRGAFFFIMERPHILREIYRVLTSGGVAFVGGGYGRKTPQKVIDAIADESRVLNDKLGRHRIALDQLHVLLRSQNLESVSRITEAGGVWLVIYKRQPLVETHVDSLTKALGLGCSENVALVGGGGKTSLMFHLAHELASAEKKVISTTTTHIVKPSAKEAPCLIVEPDEAVLIEQLMQALLVHRHVTLASTLGDDGKLNGLLPEVLDKICGLHIVDYIINEADGAGCKPVKAPRHGEPLIPATTTLVVALVGLDALEKPLSEEIAFRIELIRHLTGLPRGGVMTDEVIATLLTQPQGIMQNTPPSARIIPFLNKSDLVTAEDSTNLAAAVLSRRHMQVEYVVAGSLAQPFLYRIFHSATLDGGKNAK